MPKATMKNTYGVKWFDGMEWVGPFATLTAKQAIKVAKDMEKNVPVKIVHLK